MAKKEISIVLRAKNAMAAGIASAGAALKSFGQSAVKIGAFFAKAFLGAGTAIAGFAVKALAAYSQQEKAERSLIAAMDAFGEAGAAKIGSLKAIASAIQDETGVADENTLAQMAQLRMLGVSTEKLGAAAKATIGLKAAGMEGAAATRAVALAMEGNFSALSRYIPALRNATSEAEKAQIVNDFVSRGYKQQSDTLDTVGGQWGALKGRIGDVWEEVGAAIAQNGLLVNALKKAGDAVRAFGDRVKAWAEGGGVQRLIFGFRYFFEYARNTFTQIGNYSGLAWAAMSDGAQTAWNYIKNVSVAGGRVIAENFKLMVGYAAAAWEKIKAPSSTFTPPSTDAFIAAMGELVDAAAGKDAAVSARTIAAMEEISAAEVEHAGRIQAIMDEQLASFEKIKEAQVEAEQDALDRIVIANEEAAAAIIESWRDVNDIKNDIKDAENDVKEAETEKDAANDETERARRRFHDKDFRLKEREEQRRAEREKRNMDRALDAGRRGRKGAHIDRAKAAADAEAKAKLADEKEYQALIELKALQEELAEINKETAKNTGRTADEVNGLRGDLTGGE